MTTIQWEGTFRIYLIIQANFCVGRSVDIYGLWKDFTVFVKSCRFDQSVNLYGASITSSAEVCCSSRMGYKPQTFIYSSFVLKQKIIINLNERRINGIYLFNLPAKLPEKMFFWTLMGITPSSCILKEFLWLINNL